jgi:hypothetical protein
MTNDRLAWLFVFVALYATYCVFWGVDCARGRRSAMDFFLAERGVPSWVYVAAATTLTFTGWVAIGLPATILRDGFPGAALALGRNCHAARRRGCRGSGCSAGGSAMSLRFRCTPTTSADQSFGQFCF